MRKVPGAATARLRAARVLGTGAFFLARRASTGVASHEGADDAGDDHGVRDNHPALGRRPRVIAPHRPRRFHSRCPIPCLDWHRDAQSPAVGRPTSGGRRSAFARILGIDRVTRSPMRASSFRPKPAPPSYRWTCWRASLPPVVGDGKMAGILRHGRPCLVLTLAAH